MKMEWKQISDNMQVRHLNNVDVDYVVIKIDGKTYSTERNNNLIVKMQLANTKNIGLQINTWVKGMFVECENHNKLQRPLPFEFNIYTKLPKDKQKTFESWYE